MNTPVKLAIVRAIEGKAAADALVSHLFLLRHQGHIEFTAPEEATILLVLLSARLVCNAALTAKIDAAFARGAMVAPVRWSTCEIPQSLTRPLPAGTRTGWIATMGINGYFDEQWTAVARAVRDMVGKEASPS